MDDFFDLVFDGALDLLDLFATEPGLALSSCEFSFPRGEGIPDAREETLGDCLFPLLPIFS